MLDEGSFVSWDSEPLAVPMSESYARELADARAGHRPGRIGADRRGAHIRAPGGGGGLRVQLPRRLDRGGGGRTDHRRRAAGDRRAAAAAGLAELRRHPHAGGHGRVSADGEDRRGRQAAQTGAPALPGLPAQPDHRRGLRVVGLAGPCHRRRAGRPDRLPRPSGVRAALRRTIPGRRPDRGEPAATRGDRRRRCARGAATRRWIAR